MNNFIFENATKTIFGPGCVEEYLSCLVKKTARTGTVMLVYGGGSIKENGVYEEVMSSLQRSGKTVVEFPGIMSNPTYAKVMGGAECARENNVGLILGVGGGSVMDCCKAISLAAVYKGDAWAEWGLHVDYISPILMVDNFLPGFDMNEKMAIDKQEDKQLEAAYQDVQARKKFIPEATEAGRELHRMVAKRKRETPPAPGSPFVIEESCNGCGLCARVCPARNITIEMGKPVHGNICEFCLACANLCPKKAVKLRMPERNPEARYRNPHIGVNEIIAANGER